MLLDPGHSQDNPLIQIFTTDIYCISFSKLKEGSGNPYSSEIFWVKFTEPAAIDIISEDLNHGIPKKGLHQRSWRIVICFWASICCVG